MYREKCKEGKAFRDKPTLLNVIALIFNVANTASLSAMLGSSTDDIFADSITHISHKLILTAWNEMKICFQLNFVLGSYP